MLEQKKSLARNAILNLIKNVSSVAFPLITYPYASRVLQVDNMGKYNFANSIVSYFLLLAALGISAYAIREGSGLKEKRSDFEYFANQMFSINVISTVISIVTMLIVIAASTKLQQYTELILVLSMVLPFTTVGVNWIYSIYEEYQYITTRSIAFQFISMVLLFLVVHNENDIIKYALITVISNAGSNLLNVINSRKYCHLRFTLHIDWQKHLKPILIIFVTNIAITIYVSSDITALGIFGNDYNVGLYGLAAKVYSIVKSGITALFIVVQVRISFYAINKMDKQFKALANKVYNALLIFVLPATVGVFALSKQIVLILGGESYIEASSSLQILSLALFFSVFATFFNICILMPKREENAIFILTLISAVVNIVLNILLVPVWLQNACALTTVIAEGICCIGNAIVSRKHIKLENNVRIILPTIAGCASILAISLSLSQLISNMYISTVIIVPCSVIAYVGTQVVGKNPVAMEVLDKVKVKIRKGGH